jgi:predicted adenylyl cyclase CyaB
VGKNVEIKAFLDDVVEFEKLVEAISDSNVQILNHHDVFFNCFSGRLKLRIFNDAYGELISYHRMDSDAPVASSYNIFPTDDPAGLKISLESSLGISGEVIKERHLYSYRNARIHVDRVECLGSFLEIEDVLNEEDHIDQGIFLIDELTEKLSINKTSLIDVAYVDMF